MNFNKKTVRDIDVRGKKVLIRCDFNTPIDENGHLTDERRIQGALPTLRYLITSGAAVIVVSHLGRPKGQYNPKYTLKPVANRLSELLKMPVTLANDVIGEDADRLCAAIQPGEIVMLENVRFHKEEEKNDPAFSQKLASYADVYVNDAFGTSHRAHSSTAGVAAYLPAVCGFLIEKEISVIGKALTNPARPFVAITGGAKVSDKIGVINALIDQCDTVIIGGAMSYTFLRALSGEVGNSPCELDKLDVAADILMRALEGNVRLVLPDDVVVKDNQPYTADGGSFPSGHTNTGYTDALLLAAMIPERYDALVTRGARYGYSRIVLGVHYPLDVIGSRMVAERNVAHYLNDPHYRVLFNEARDQLRAALAKACGTSLAECAKSSVKDDPWRDPAMRDFSRFTMTYDLPQQKGPQPRLQVPEGAEVLLEAALPQLSAAQRRALMVNTALPAGYPLSGTTPEQQFWQRLNLSAAWEMAQKRH